MRVPLLVLLSACGASAATRTTVEPAPTSATSSLPGDAAVPAADAVGAPPTVVAIRRERTIFDTYVVFAKVSSAGLELLPEDETRVGDEFGWFDEHTLLAIDSLEGKIVRFVDGVRDDAALPLPLGRGVTGVFASDGELWLGECLPGSTCAPTFTRLVPGPTLKQAAEPPRARLITDAPDPETVAAPPQVSCPLLGPNPRWVHRDPPIYETGDRTSTERTYHRLCDPVPFLYVGLGGELWARFVAYGGGLTFGVWTFYDGARELGTIDTADALLRANR